MLKINSDNGAGLLPGAGGGSSSMVVVAADVVAVVEVAVVPMPLPAIDEMKCTNGHRFWPNDASEGVPKQWSSVFFQYVWVQRAQITAKCKKNQNDRHTDNATM
jgi:hypothetical protein